ncbi:MAG TPA: glycosyltransferase family 2 protein [Candidatus Saccharimonadales bacterium]|nr:glycosyltransferase family 2 protein [Candidatus Saccharimonadales bacterium]
MTRSEYIMATVKGRGTPDFTRRTADAEQRRGTSIVHRTANYTARPTELERSGKQPLLLTAGRVASIAKRVHHTRKKKLALLLPGHNEELIIATTIASAIKAGQPREDIYVVDDGSEDFTRREALKMLPKRNVLSKPKGGKARAVLSGIEEFNIEERYTWLHVADADSVFCPDYFRMYKRKLDARKYAVAVGFVQSLRGNWISRYRAFTYTYSQQVIRRVQSWFGMISVFPGPITCFRTDIIKHLDFTANSMTEDFDLTLQVHRKKLGKIRYIPEAINYTQDPQTLSDFIKQNLRWQRGFFQGVIKYRIGMRPHAVDLGLGYQMLELLFYLIQMFVLLPYIVITTHQWKIVPIVVLSDFLVTCALAIFSSIAARRASIMASLPYFYFLRWIEISIVVIAYFEVVAMRKFRGEKFAGWSTKGRRYALDANALKDTA